MFQIESLRRPSPSPSRSSIRSERACRQPRVIQVNRDVATMVESARTPPGWEGRPPPAAPPHAPFRSRTFSDGFIRNTSQELLLGVDCDACRAYRLPHRPDDCPSADRLCVDGHVAHHEFDLVCDCSSNRNRENGCLGYCPEGSELRGHAFDPYDVERHPREPRRATSGAHHSLDRRHTRAKAAGVSGYISRQLISYDPANNIVQKIKRNLSNLRRIGGDVVTKKHGMQLSEMPPDSSASLKRPPRPRSDAARIFTSDEFRADGELRLDTSAYAAYAADSDRCFDRTKDYSFTVERKAPSKIVKMRSFDSNDRLISRSSATLGQTKYSTVDGRGGRCKSIPRQLSYSDFVQERGGGVGAPGDALEPWPVAAPAPAPSRDEDAGLAGEPRTFSREFTEPELVMLEASPRAAHCRCTCDKKLSSIFYNSQGEKRPTPAPDVTTGGAVGAGGAGGGRECGACGKTGARWSSTGTASSHSSTTTGNSSRVTVAHRRWCCVAALVLVAGTACVAGPLALRAPPGAPLHERLRLADRLLHDTPLVDGHNDLPWNIRKFLHNKIKDFKFDEDLRTMPPWATSSWSHTDLPRLKQGRVAAQFWAAYVPCDSQHRDAVQLIFEQIDLIQRLTDKYHPQLTLCTSASDIVAAHANHRMCSLVGVEGGHAIGGSLGVLRTLYQLGVRYLTLTSTCDTPWAECASAAERPDAPPHGGLTPFGKVVVKEMNRLGMLVDLSHVSARTMRDALAVSRAPVLFSHSAARALCNTTRNVPDAVLRRLAANGGLVMVNFYASFLTCRNTATVHDAIAHINHIRDVAGVDSVGLGAGFDGINYTPQGLEDVSSYPLLFAELMEAGWTMDELRKLAGLNLLRVLGAAERVARELAAAQVAPYEDTPPRPPDPHNCSSQDL